MPNTAGRPRDGSIDTNILSATATLLKDKGYAGLTMDAVASKAKVSKHTLYLRYKSPAELTVALLKNLTDTTAPIPNTGTLREDLKQVLHGIRQLFYESPFGVVVPALIGASTDNPELIRHARSYLAKRRISMKPVVTNAIQRGELPPNTSPAALLEVLIAPLYYRHLISGEAIDDVFINDVVSLVLDSN